MSVRFIRILGTALVVLASTCAQALPPQTDQLPEEQQYELHKAFALETMGRPSDAAEALEPFVEAGVADAMMAYASLRSSLNLFASAGTVRRLVGKLLTIEYPYLMNQLDEEVLCAMPAYRERCERQGYRDTLRELYVQWGRRADDPEAYYRQYYHWDWEVGGRFTDWVETNISEETWDRQNPVEDPELLARMDEAEEAIRDEKRHEVMALLAEGAQKGCGRCAVLVAEYYGTLYREEGKAWAKERYERYREQGREAILACEPGTTDYIVVAQYQQYLGEWSNEEISGTLDTCIESGNKSGLMAMHSAFRDQYYESRHESLDESVEIDRPIEFQLALQRFTRDGLDPSDDFWERTTAIQITNLTKRADFTESEARALIEASLPYYEQIKDQLPYWGMRRYKFRASYTLPHRLLNNPPTDSEHWDDMELKDVL